MIAINHAPVETTEPRTFVYLLLSGDEHENRLQGELIEKYLAEHSELMPVASTERDQAGSARLPIRQRPAFRRISAAVREGDRLVIDQIERLGVGQSLFSGIDACFELCDQFRIAIWPIDFVFPAPLELATPRGQNAIGAARWIVDRQRSAMRKCTQRALAERRARGLAYGTPSYGWTTTGTRAKRRLVAVPDEQTNINILLDLHRRGLSSVRIVEVMNEAGRTVPERLYRGRPWKDRHVRKLIVKEEARLRTPDPTDAAIELELAAVAGH